MTLKIVRDKPTIVPAKVVFIPESEQSRRALVRTGVDSVQMWSLNNYGGWTNSQVSLADLEEAVKEMKNATIVNAPTGVLIKTWLSEVR